MAIWKRGKFYQYGFWRDGKYITRSTRQGNRQVASDLLAAHRTNLARGEAGLVERRSAPTLAQYCNSQFLPRIRSSVAPKTWAGWIIPNVRAILRYKPIADLPLDAITADDLVRFAAHRKGSGHRGLKPSSVNSSLRVLRLILNSAVESKHIDAAPKIRKLPGEAHREHVVTPTEEQRYLLCSDDLLRSLATVLVDTGMRPDEAHRLEWDCLDWSAGRFGAIFIRHGKTKAARRHAPLTARASAALEERWVAAGKPREGFVWANPDTASKHIEMSSYRKRHLAAIRATVQLDENGEPIKGTAIRKFVIYDLRHTFLTRLGESGIDVWTLARIAGHSAIAISQRYVHPGQDAVTRAMSRFEDHHAQLAEKN